MRAARPSYACQATTFLPKRERRKARIPGWYPGLALLYPALYPKPGQERQDAACIRGSAAEHAAVDATKPLVVPRPCAIVPQNPIVPRIVPQPKKKKARPLHVVVWPCLEPYILEAWTGIEPVNNGFADRSLSHLGTTPRRPALRARPSGAGDGTRTHGILLGKQTLYH